MNIVMATNTYRPHVGGVARSVEAFSQELIGRGHRVLVIAPEFDGHSDDVDNVVRVPALQNFNGSDFAVQLPMPRFLTDRLRAFQPQIVHSHHPFLLGGAALRIAAAWNVPLVFTHHTMYEQYTHYVPGDSPLLKRFAVELATSYANLCDHVIAPSESVAAILHERGVESPVTTVPTGVETGRFERGDGRRFRRSCGLPGDAFVVGHVGRLAEEKNLGFLAAAVAHFLRKFPRAHFLVAGNGPARTDIRQRFARERLSHRLHFAGVLQAGQLTDAYAAMDVFAFASHSETQGIVLTEAMAAGVPVVAVDATGVREVVDDRKNGRIVYGDQLGSFQRALSWVAGRSDEERRALSETARQTARRFSMPKCAERLLAVYEGLLGSEPSRKHFSDSKWEAALRQCEAEWQLWSSRARAAGAALDAQIHPSRIPGLRQIVSAWRRFRNWISRREWTIRLLRLPPSPGPPSEPGLILIQIDGLSRTQFERALSRRRMPFLKRLLTGEGYKLHTLYSGLPASTPAVQGELFYGVESAVPAFSFREEGSGEVVKMIEPDAAARVQNELSKKGTGLLQQGSAYSDIYTGDAAEPHFCPAAMGWGSLLENTSAWRSALVIAWNTMSMLRTAGYFLLELIVAIVDCASGLIRGRDLRQELKFVPSRVAVSVLMREWIAIGAEVDATRGLPIIHVNFLGYDEQAHRRGPSSAFAHWSLKGIDRAIQRIWNAAHASPRRDYRFWIYSDHGQEQSTPYLVETGRTLQEAVDDVFSALSADDKRRSSRRQRISRGISLQRSEWLGGRLFQKLLPRPEDEDTDIERSRSQRDSRSWVPPAVADKGPVAHIYCSEGIGEHDRDQTAKLLVEQAELPLVCFVRDADAVVAWTPRGRFLLPRDAEKVFGSSHPLLEEVTRDWLKLCRHREAGDFVISGWRSSAPALSFVVENGSHAGPGPEETRAFALLPGDVVLPVTKKPFLRPYDLREAALRTLGRRSASAKPAHRKDNSSVGTLRLMTYNVHSCIGCDGKLSPGRISRVIAQFQPDVVALQEIDVGRALTGHVDQAAEIARETNMFFHFDASFEIDGEKYGNAVLSRYPLQVMRSGALPRRRDGRITEPRVAQWVSIEISGWNLHLINTHLGLATTERRNQIEHLLGGEWLSNAECVGPVVLCGDFNARPGSIEYRKICAKFRDAQLLLSGHRPRKTWFSRWPLTRIDHVFVNDWLDVRSIEVPNTQLTRVASDHLPLLVDVALSSEPVSHKSGDVNGKLNSVSGCTP